MISDIAGAVTFSCSIDAVSTITITYEGEETQLQVTSPYFVDGQLTLTEGAFQHHSLDEDGNPLEDTYNELDIAADPEGYAASKTLTIGNEIEYTRVTNSYEDYKSYQLSDSGFVNAWGVLDGSMFENILPRYFELDIDKLNAADPTAARRLMTSICGSFYAAGLEELTIVTDGYRPVQFYGHSATYHDEIEDFDYKYEVDNRATFSGTFLTYGDYAEASKNFIEPKEGTEDPEFVSAMEALSAGNYEETYIEYQVAGTDDIASQVGTFTGCLDFDREGTKYSENGYDESLTQITSYGYYVDDQGVGHELRGFAGKGYFVNGEPDTRDLPEFDISSLFFEETSPGVYVYEAGDDVPSFTTGEYSLATDLNVIKCTVTIDGDSYKIESFYVRPGIVNYDYYKATAIFSRIGEANSGIDTSKIRTDSEVVTWGEFFAETGQSIYSAEQIFGNLEALEYIPKLNGHHLDPYIYADLDAAVVQFSYDDGSTRTSDFNHDYRLDQDDELKDIGQRNEAIIKEYLAYVPEDEWDIEITKDSFGYYNRIAATRKEAVAINGIHYIVSLEAYVASVNPDGYYATRRFCINPSLTKVTHDMVFNYNYEGCPDPVVMAVPEGGGIRPAELPELHRPGYVFDGWYLDPECTKTAYSVLYVCPDDTLNIYAKWKEVGNVTITWVDGDNVVTEEVPYDTPCYSRETEIREGYYSVWYTDLALTEYLNQEIAAGGRFTSDRTIYCRWIEGHCNVRFYLNYNPGDLYNNDDYIEGGDISVPINGYLEESSLPTPIRDGYTFGGWYLDEECTKPFDASSRITDYYLALYAKWEAVEAGS